MGLDMYAYTAKRAGQHNEYFEQEGLTFDSLAGKWAGGDPSVEPTEEIAYWRKHPNLHGWMEQLWIRKLASEGKTPEVSEWGSSFNGVELELTAEDLNELEHAVNNFKLPKTQGFFFGNDSDHHYFENDVAFIHRARDAIDEGLKVFYNSSW